MTNKIKQQIRFHYLMTEIQLCTLIFWLFFTYILQDILIKIKDTPITNNIFRRQSDHSVMCGFYCIAFMEYTIAWQILLDYTNLYSNDYQKNVKIIYKYFKDKCGKRKHKSWF